LFLWSAGVHQFRNVGANSFVGFSLNKRHYGASSVGIKCRAIEDVVRTIVTNSVVVDDGPFEDSQCIEWCGAIDSCGYGVTRLGGRMVPTHRLIYEFLNGSVPDDMQINHLCEHKSCGNPLHMEVVTHLENQRYNSPHSGVKRRKCEHNNPPRTPSGRCRQCRVERRREVALQARERRDNYLIPRLIKLVSNSSFSLPATSDANSLFL
jgi:hypothetical protein